MKGPAGRINVQGVIYDIHFCKPAEDEKLQNMECDGYCDVFAKKIVVEDLVNKEHEVADCGEPRLQMEKILTHELVHAHLHESGLNACSHKDWAMNEEMVDWIALQLDKIFQSSLKAQELISEYGETHENTKH